MKKLALAVACALVVWLSVPVGAAIAYVQQAANGVTGTDTAAVAYGSNVTAGNLLVVLVKWGDPLTFTSLSDSQGNTYQLDVSRDDVVPRGRIYSAIAGSTGANTVTFVASSAGRMGLAIHEFSGTFSACRVDQTTQTSGTSSTPDSGNITTTVANDLLFGGLTYTAGTSSPITGGTGYSNVIEQSTGRLAAQSKIVSGTVTDSADWTLSASDTWVSLIASYSEASCPTTGGQIFRFGSGQ